MSNIQINQRSCNSISLCDMGVNFHSTESERESCYRAEEGSRITQCWAPFLSVVRNPDPALQGSKESLFLAGSRTEPRTPTQISSLTKMPFLSTFPFLTINLTVQHHPNHCSLTTTGEKVQHSIFEIPSMGSSLTKDEGTDRQCHLCMDKSHLLVRADGRSCTQLMSEQAGWALSQSLDTRGRHSSEVQTCSIDTSFPPVERRPPPQNPCRTTTPDNSLKRDRRSNILHIYYITSGIFGVEISPTPLPFAS